MSLKPTDSVASGSNEDNASTFPSAPSSYDTSPNVGASGPDSYSSYRYPGEGDSASQYSSPVVGSVNEAKASYVDVGNLGALTNDDYREDGALPAGGPAWGVTDDSAGDSDQYGPGIDTARLG